MYPPLLAVNSPVNALPSAESFPLNAPPPSIFSLKVIAAPSMTMSDSGKPLMLTPVNVPLVPSVVFVARSTSMAIAWFGM
jgi:hypothetical protein